MKLSLAPQRLEPGEVEQFPPGDRCGTPKKLLLKSEYLVFVAGCDEGGVAG